MYDDGGLKQGCHVSNSTGCIALVAFILIKLNDKRINSFSLRVDK